MADSEGRRRSVAALSDADLVVALGRQDQEALAEIYRRHWPIVHRAAVRICGPGRADDVTQEVFLRLWDKPERYRSERGSLQRFLLMQTRGGAIDSLRSDQARRAREGADSGRRARFDAEVEPVQVVRLEGVAVSQALTQLPDLERRAVVLAYFGGYSYREVATLLATPEGTVKSRIRAALGRLRGPLSDEVDDEAATRGAHEGSTVAHPQLGLAP